MLSRVARVLARWIGGLVFAVVIGVVSTLLATLITG